MMKRHLIAVLLTSLLATSLTTQAKEYYGSHLCGYPGFKCIKIQRGDTWARLFPNKRDREIVKRLNRTNIALRYRSWIVVPDNISKINNLDISPLPHSMNTEGKKLLYVDLSKHAFGAYNPEGELIHWGPVSGGQPYCSDVGRSCKTILGSFKIYRKQGPGCKSTKYPIETNGGAPMPYCMHFKGGYALHGSQLPGYHASHGCVRLFFDDAQWLNKHFLDIGTPVTVTH